MSGFSYSTPLQAGTEKAESSGRKHPIGTRGITRDGRVFYYGKAGEAVNAGSLCMMAQFAGASQINIAVNKPPFAAYAVGDRVIKVANTTKAGTWAANDFANGYIMAEATTAAAVVGVTYQIKSNTARATSNSTLTFTLYEGDEVAIALTTNSRVHINPNPYFEFEAWDIDDIDGPPVGVATHTFTINYYGWLQTWGPCSVKYDIGGSTKAVLGFAGIPAGTSGADGAIERVHDTGTTVAINLVQQRLPVIGRFMGSSTYNDGRQAQFDLTIRP